MIYGSRTQSARAMRVGSVFTRTSLRAARWYSDKNPVTNCASACSLSAISGAGLVGATAAFALSQSGLASEIVLIDANAQRAQGEALDIEHGAALAPPVLVRDGDYPDLADAHDPARFAQLAVRVWGCEADFRAS